ncbi:hypothetical protein Q2T40_00470 [Winogradskyella maritima]|nr:hypothetical protein [Winogradskyella maritima]
MSKFKIDKSNWKSIPIESVKFILSEAKDYLDYTLVESNKITSRAYSIIYFCLQYYRPLLDTLLIKWF